MTGLFAGNTRNCKSKIRNLKFQTWLTETDQKFALLFTGAFDARYAARLKGRGWPFTAA
jgi:hypothetical protein